MAELMMSRHVTKTKLYLDTSIPSAYFDYSKPLRQLITQKWFENETMSYELYMSVLTVEEVEQLENIRKKDNIKDLLLNHKVKILELTNKAVDLAMNIWLTGRFQNQSRKMPII